MALSFRFRSGNLFDAWMATSPGLFCHCGFSGLNSFQTKLPENRTSQLRFSLNDQISQASALSSLSSLVSPSRSSSDSVTGQQHQASPNEPTATEYDARVVKSCQRSKFVARDLDTVKQVVELHHLSLDVANKALEEAVKLALEILLPLVESFILGPTTIHGNHFNSNETGLIDEVKSTDSRDSLTRLDLLEPPHASRATQMVRNELCQRMDQLVVCLTAARQPPELTGSAVLVRSLGITGSNYVSATEMNSLARANLPRTPPLMGIRQLGQKNSPVQNKRGIGETKTRQALLQRSASDPREIV
ncbi:unnamed protein product [Protopolystoma xenopodis]|uniref:Uncharacterized protein n=1 Tax=Protopolystoma xenopodis TaxID=117903 RepID=A0A448XKN4_9PLAT|nr:unnamed protein product [Protopolystoma xenopodis]